MLKIAYIRGFEAASARLGVAYKIASDIPAAAMAPLVAPALAAATSAYQAPEGEGVRAGLLAGGGGLGGMVAGGTLGAFGGEALLKHLLQNAPAGVADKGAWAARILGGLAGSVAGGAAGGYGGHQVAKHTSQVPSWAWEQKAF